MKRTLKISNIFYKIKSDIELNSLNYKGFEDFRVKSDKEDIVFNLFNIKDNSKYKVSPEKISNLLTNSSFKICKHENSLISFDIFIYKYLKKIKSISSFITIAIYIDLLMIFDFKNKEVNLFCTKKEGEILKKAEHDPFFLANFLHLNNAIMIHSSAIILEKKAILFVAPGEGGKTTIAELLHKKYPIITDDQNIIRKENDKYYCYGTPWGLYTNKSAKAEIGGIFLLEKSDKFKLTPLNSNYIFAFLCREHYTNFTYLRDEGRKKYFGLLSDICNKFPVYKLQFPKDYIDPDAIAAVMKE